MYILITKQGSEVIVIKKFIFRYLNRTKYVLTCRLYIKISVINQQRL